MIVYNMLQVARLIGIGLRTTGLVGAGVGMGLVTIIMFIKKVILIKFFKSVGLLFLLPFIGVVFLATVIFIKNNMSANEKDCTNFLNRVTKKKLFSFFVLSSITTIISSYCGLLGVYCGLFGVYFYGFIKHIFLEYGFYAPELYCNDSSSSSSSKKPLASGSSNSPKEPSGSGSSDNPKKPFNVIEDAIKTNSLNLINEREANALLELRDVKEKLQTLHIWVDEAVRLTNRVHPDRSDEENVSVFKGDIAILDSAGTKGVALYKLIVMERKLAEIKNNNYPIYDDIREIEAKIGETKTLITWMEEKEKSLSNRIKKDEIRIKKRERENR